MKTLEELEVMEKDELVELVLKMQEKSGIKRKDEVLALIENEAMAIEDIAEQLGISAKNVSSQLSYLRKDGYKIVGWTDKETKKQMRQIMA